MKLYASYQADCDADSCTPMQRRLLESNLNKFIVQRDEKRLNQSKPVASLVDDHAAIINFNCDRA